MPMPRMKNALVKSLNWIGCKTRHLAFIVISETFVSPWYGREMIDPKTNQTRLPQVRKPVILFVNYRLDDNGTAGLFLELHTRY